MWTKFYFGKYKGLTAPQVAVRDPGYIDWCCRDQVVQGALAEELVNIRQKIQTIPLPKDRRGTHTIEFLYTYKGEFLGLEIVPRDQVTVRGSTVDRNDHLNLFMRTDKTSFKVMVKWLKHHWFDNRSLTKARLEAFFDDTNEAWGIELQTEPEPADQPPVLDDADAFWKSLKPKRDPANHRCKILAVD